MAYETEVAQLVQDKFTETRHAMRSLQKSVEQLKVILTSFLRPRSGSALFVLSCPCLQFNSYVKKNHLLVLPEEFLEERQPLTHTQIDLLLKRKPPPPLEYPNTIALGDVVGSTKKAKLEVEATVDSEPVMTSKR